MWRGSTQLLRQGKPIVLDTYSFSNNFIGRAYDPRRDHIFFSLFFVLFLAQWRTGVEKEKVVTKHSCLYK
jgi:hypothetical protein